MSDQETGPGGPESFGLPPPRPDSSSSGPEGLEARDNTDRARHWSMLLRQKQRWLVLTAAAVAVAVAVVGASAASRSGSAPQPSVAPTAAAPSLPLTSPTARPTAAAPSLPLTSQTAVAGWSTVKGREQVAFDVPPDWTVEAADAFAGFDSHSMTEAPQLVVMHDLASYKSGACPHLQASSRGRAGFVVPGDLAGPDAAAEISEKWAYVVSLDNAGDRPRVGPTTVTPALVAGGTIAAVEATTILTITHPEPCQPPAMAFTAVTFHVAGRLVVFVLYTDEGVADSLGPDVARRIITSLRPVGS